MKWNRTEYSSSVRLNKGIGATGYEISRCIVEKRSNSNTFEGTEGQIYSTVLCKLLLMVRIILPIPDMQMHR